jgi:hypothetical protein
LIIPALPNPYATSTCAALFLIGVVMRQAQPGNADPGGLYVKESGL